MTHHPQDPYLFPYFCTEDLVGGESFFKIQNLIADEAKNATLVALDSTFVEFLDHFLSQLNKKVRGPKVCNLTLP